MSDISFQPTVIWQNIVKECDNLDKVNHKITEKLSDIDTTISKAVDNAVLLQMSMESYHKVAQEVHANIQGWSKFFDEFRLMKDQEKTSVQFVDEGRVEPATPAQRKAPLKLGTCTPKADNVLLRQLFKFGLTPKVDDQNSDISFTESPPVTIQFVKPSALNEVASASTNMPSTPSCAQELLNRLPLETPITNSEKDRSWLLKTGEVINRWAEESNATPSKRSVDDFSFEFHRRRSSIYNYNSDHDTPRSIQGLDLALSPIRRRSSIGISYDLEEAKNHSVFDANDLDVTYFPTSFQHGNGHLQLKRLHELFVANPENSLKMEAILITLPDFDHERCNLLLDLLLRKKYITRKMVDGEHYWRINK